MKRKSVKARIQKLFIGALSVAVIAGTMTGLSDVAKADGMMKPANVVNEEGKLEVVNVDVGSPYSYSVFTRTFSQGNHVEGTVAAENINLGLQINGYFAGQGSNSQAYVAKTTGGLMFQNYNTNLVIGDATPAFSGIDLAEVTASLFTSSNGNLTSYTISSTDYMNQSIEAAFDGLEAQSQAYRTTTTSDNTIVYDLADGSSINDALVQEIQAYAEADKQVIVNVGGSVVSDQKNWNGPMYAWWANNIVWNFYDATEVNLNNNTYGTIYALNATVRNTNWIVGRVFCNEFQQNGEVHAPDVTTKPAPSPSPSEEPSPSPSEEPSPSPSPSEEPSPSPSEEPSPSPSPSEEPSPSPSEEPSPSPSPSEEPSPSPSEGPSPSPSPSEEPSPSPNEEPSPSPSPSEEPSPSPSEEPSPSPSPSEEPSPSPSEEPSPSPSPSEEPSPSPSEEPSPSPSEEPSPSPSEEPSPSPSPSEEPSPSPSPSEEPSPSPSPVSTPTPTSESTPTPSTTPEMTPSTTPEITPISIPEEPPQVLGRKRPRIVSIDDEATPLADGAVLGSDRRPQTSDESDMWAVAFLASLSGLTAWLLAGKKRS